MKLTPKHQKIADDINKAFEKVAHCDHCMNGLKCLVINQCVSGFIMKGVIDQ